MNPDEHTKPDIPMDPDNYQQAWQAHSSQTRVTVDADLLLRVVQRSQRDFRATILRRDIIEVGVGLLMLPYWIYQGLTSSLPWTWWLTVPAIIWVVGYFLVDRMRHPQTRSDPGEPLLSSVKNSLTQVEHQIWLLRNVFWWYLMPFTISISAFFAHAALLRSNDWLDALAHIDKFVFLFGLYGFIDWLNQRAVRCELEPRRQELLTLLASLGDESTQQPAAITSSKSVEIWRILRRWLIIAFLCLVALVVIGLASTLSDSSYDGPARSSGPGGDSLAGLISDLRREKILVGLAAMVMVDGQVEAAAAHGERKIGSDVPLEIGDRWHLGGITKSITATMIARLVEAGRMQWSDTIGEIFAEASVHEDWKQVTLRQLLTDTAGAPANFPSEVSRHRPPLGPESTQARREAVLNVIADKPAYPPGEKYLYSNVGYTIAGAMAEKATGANWDELVKQGVFDPLELAEAGFGPPKSGDDTLEQPRGHRTRLAGKVPVDDDADNTSIMGPSGIVHMTLRDLCTYATEHLRGDLGEGKLLSAETYKLLHAREFGPYSSGWIRRIERGSERPYTVYWHNGSNTMWYALVVFIPEKAMVVAVTSNDGDSESAEAAAWEIVRASVKEFKVEVERPRRESPIKTDYPKRAPFTGVRWEGDKPAVKMGDDWFALVSLDGIAAEDIVAFSRHTYANLWQKRFEEDLVELLTRMEHPPQDTVTLVVRQLASSETRTLKDVPMTEANRQAIYRANDESPPARERDAAQPATRPAVPIEDAALFRSRIDDSFERKQKSHSDAYRHNLVRAQYSMPQ